MHNNSRADASMSGAAESLSQEISRFQPVYDNNSLNANFKDLFTTEEQKKRDEKITELLRYYTENYKRKSDGNKHYKRIIFGVSISILIVFSFIILYLFYRCSNMKDADLVNHLSVLVTACVTYLTLVIGILKIITQYVFPKNEEEYITRIVQSIQKNDLAHKKANIKNSRPNT